MEDNWWSTKKRQPIDLSNHKRRQQSKGSYKDAQHNTASNLLSEAMPTNWAFLLTVTNSILRIPRYPLVRHHSESNVISSSHFVHWILLGPCHSSDGTLNGTATATESSCLKCSYFRVQSHPCVSAGALRRRGRAVHVALRLASRAWEDGEGETCPIRTHKAEFFRKHRAWKQALSVSRKYSRHLSLSSSLCFGIWSSRRSFRSFPALSQWLAPVVAKPCPRNNEHVNTCTWPKIFSWMICHPSVGIIIRCELRSLVTAFQFS